MKLLSSAATSWISNLSFGKLLPHFLRSLSLRTLSRTSFSIEEKTKTLLYRLENCFSRVEDKRTLAVYSWKGRKKILIYCWVDWFLVFFNNMWWRRQRRESPLYWHKFSHLNQIYIPSEILPSKKMWFISQQETAKVCGKQRRRGRMKSNVNPELSIFIARKIACSCYEHEAAVISAALIPPAIISYDD